MQGFVAHAALSSCVGTTIGGLFQGFTLIGVISLISSDLLLNGSVATFGRNDFNGPNTVARCLTPLVFTR